MRLTCVYEEVRGGGYIAYLEEIPGANTQGATLDEARANLRDAIEMVLAANREIAEARINGRGARVIREPLSPGL